jgi:hypothetical protein
LVYEIEPPRADSVEGTYIIVPEPDAAAWELTEPPPASDPLP